MYLKTLTRLQLNETINISFTISFSGKDVELSCCARVAWTNYEDSELKLDYPPGVGLEFNDLPEDDLKHLSKFILNYDENKKMNMVCAWCGKYLGTRKGPNGKTGHGICGNCREEYFQSNLLFYRDFTNIQSGLVAMKNLIYKALFGALLCLFFLAPDLEAKIYKWVDDKETVHFSDKPQSGDAKEIKVKSTGISVTGNKEETDSTQAQNVPETPPKNTKNKTPDPDIYQKPKQITEADYRISSNVGKMGADAIRISGRITSGPRCENLAVEATAQTDTGLSATIRIVLRSQGHLVL